MVKLNDRRVRADQLEQLLEGSLDLADAPRDVRNLATLATTVTTELTIPVLEAEARDRIRTRVLAEVHNDLHEAADARVGTRRTRRRVAVATGVASALIGTSGVAVAAQDALPGDALYTVKQATESVRVAVAGDLTEQGRLHLALAAERLEEVAGAIERGDVRDEALVDTLARMDARSLEGAEALVRVAERSGEDALLDEVAVFTEQQARGIVAVFDELPVTVRPHAEDSLATLRTIRSELLAGHEFSGSVASASGGDLIAELLRSDPLPAAPAGPSGSGDDPGDTGTGADIGTAGEGSTSPELPLPDGGGSTDQDGDVRTVVPRLPGPLDDLGESVDDAVGGVVDGAEELLDDSGDTVDDVVDETDEALDDVTDGIGDTLDDMTGGIGDALDDTTEGLDDLLGGN
ncbi:MAG: DUF5667 domain-containing protein [Nitriliruptor sp.]